MRPAHEAFTEALSLSAFHRGAAHLRQLARDDCPDPGHLQAIRIQLSLRALAAARRDRQDASLVGSCTDHRLRKKSASVPETAGENCQSVAGKCRKLVVN